MVDIGRDSAWNEDEVVLVGRQGDEALGVEQVAEAAGMIPYEVLVGLNERVPRVHVRGGCLQPE